MGNSGSMNGLASYEEGGYHHQQGYHHHHQRYHDAMRGEAGASGAMSSSWMDSYQRGEHGRRAGGGGGGAGPRDYDYLHHMHDQKPDDSGHFSGGSQQQQQQQIKVLPDIPGKRSKSISSPTYQQHQHSQQPASFSECDEDMQLQGAPNSQPPRLLMTRSRTQLNMVGANRAGRGRDGEPKEQEPHHRGGRPLPTGQERYADPSARTSADAAALNHRKRFGSEPDLRLSLQGPRNGAPTGDQQPPTNGGAARKPNTAQSKIMKGKNKKKAAPVPPLIEKREPVKDIERQRIIAYSPLRKPTGDTVVSSTLPSYGESSFNATATRKLRLFKTRAETKKTPAIAKLPEASDVKFSGHAAPAGPGSSLMKQGPAGGGSFHASSSSSSSSQLISLTHHQMARQQQPEPEKHAVHRPAPNPMSFFRREKTFDAGLLGLERKRAIEAPPKAKPTMSPPLSRRKSIVKSLLEQEQDGGGGARTDKPRAKANQAPAPQTGAAITDFQKELQLMARRKQSPEFNRKTAPTPTMTVANSSRPQKGPFRVQVVASGSPKPTKATKLPTAAKTLVIPVPSEKEPNQVESPPMVDGRDSSPPATPPPPPPPPKTSFYFGMCGTQRQDASRTDDHGHVHGQDRSLSTSTNDLRLAEYFAERKAQQTQPGKGSDDVPDGCDPEAERSRTPDEIGHTQMELIDQFAASLLNGSRFRSSDSVASSEGDVRVSTTGSSWDDGQQQEIALKLRPTLPRKQFDIPRFSPAAAWRLLTTEDEFCRDAVDVTTPDEGDGIDKKLTAAFLRAPTFEQEFDVAQEDRIQRVYREPVPGLQDNKSGDSGISGDAGLPELGEPALLAKDRAGGDSTPEGSTGKHGMLKQSDGGGDGGNGQGGEGGGGGWSSNALLLMPWTPQQDLEDDDDSTTGSETDAPQRGLLVENGSGGGRDGLLGDGRDFSSKGHLFSLSLPRENHLSIYNVEVNDEKVEKHVFNSLQKFRKSVSGAFKSEESGAIDSNDNWFLGRLDPVTGGVGVRGVGGVGGGSGSEKRPKLLTQTPSSYPSLDRTGCDKDAAGLDGGSGGAGVTSLTQSIHSSIGYLVSGKHMMYLPREPTKVVPAHHQQGHQDRSTGGSKQDQNNNNRAYRNQNGHGGGHGPTPSQPTSWHATASAHRESPKERKAPTSAATAALSGLSSDSLPHETVTATRREDKENLQDPVPVGPTLSTGALSAGELEQLPVKLSNRRNHRFTFQSTIRQIEKRRVAEKLSREAEIKEAMRLSELEAMRRVEEEFQKKRAREKASIRHQLRLFSMENHPDQGQHADGHDIGQHDMTGDGKRSDPDGDSLPHQNSGVGGGNGSGRGLYRRKDGFTSMERQRQYRRGTNGTLLEDGSNAKHGSSYNDFQQRQHRNNSDDEEGHRYALEDEELAGDEGVDGGDGGGEHDDDDGDNSSLGYVDTRTPYISRIIQAKSSKSYGVRK
ncbi:AGAP013009-PA-like protein [Anopheles sinensis]|uniref:AGAP013009-PA-like protein n=1 Tax=Anopheles sinensis TaxID=74873 RepID=A0A084VVH6_ANOSI|nr:AGAP013009-PA-like protein [Anopheles sinensis]